MKSEYVSSIQKCRVKRKSLQALKVNKHFGSSKRKKVNKQIPLEIVIIMDCGMIHPIIIDHGL